MSVKQRIAKLEQATNGDAEPRLLVVYDSEGGMVSTGGETMTEAEWQKRYEPKDTDFVVRFRERVESCEI